MRELGGIFTLPNSSELEKAPILNSFHDRLTDSGRSAFQLILNDLRNENSSIHMLLPEYLCEDAFLPYLEAGKIKVIYYQIDEHFRPILDEQMLSKVDAIVLISYFGCTDLSGVAEELKRGKPSLRVIFDFSQDLAAYTKLEQLPASMDYAFCSYRKFTPVISGGGLKSRKSIRGSLPEMRPFQPGSWSEALYQASLIKEKMGASPEPKQFLEEFSRHFDTYRSRLEKVTLPDSIDERSYRVLQTQDFGKNFRQRKENYRYLSDRLKNSKKVSPFFQSAVGEGPLFLPVFVSGARDALVRSLRSQGVFCPVHWPVSKIRVSTLSAFSKKVYNQGLSLLIDQRMTRIDLDRLASAIESEILPEQGRRNA